MSYILEKGSSAVTTEMLEPSIKSSASTSDKDSSKILTISRTLNDESSTDSNSVHQEITKQEYVKKKIMHEHTELGNNKFHMTCPNCLMFIETNVRYVVTQVTHAAALCLLCVCSLCVVPYCSTNFRNAEHSCPMCRVYLGTSIASGWDAMRCNAEKSTDPPTTQFIPEPEEYCNFFS